jgi:hypothetical protein
MFYLRHGIQLFPILGYVSHPGPFSNGYRIFAGTVTLK